VELEKTSVPVEQRQVGRPCSGPRTVSRVLHVQSISRRSNHWSVPRNLFAAWKRSESLPTQEALDEAHAIVDSMSGALAEPESRPLNNPTRQARLRQRRTQIRRSANDTVRITVSSLDARCSRRKKCWPAKLSLGQRAADLGALAGEFEQWRKKWAGIQPLAARHRCRERLPSSLISNADSLRSLEGKLTAMRRTAEQDHSPVGKLVDDLLENSKKLLMLRSPAGWTVAQARARSLRDRGKDAELTIRGEDVKIDKRILEELKDPLIHLLRNCVDHGVETRNSVVTPGSTPSHDHSRVSRANGNQVEIAVSDDGAGIDIEKIKTAAISRGLIAPMTRSSSRVRCAGLVFEATLDQSMITDLSGRGLASGHCARKNREARGRVVIESRRDTGTTIRMTLPLTLATFRGVLIKIRAAVVRRSTVQVERVTASSARHSNRRPQHLP